MEKVGQQTSTICEAFNEGQRPILNILNQRNVERWVVLDVLVHGNDMFVARAALKLLPLQLFVAGSRLSIRLGRLFLRLAPRLLFLCLPVILYSFDTLQVDGSAKAIIPVSEFPFAGTPSRKNTWNPTGA